MSSGRTTMSIEGASGAALGSARFTYWRFS
jgi:hypothetical protein